jgi:cyclopropane fatty-acyl-phospholipid synthase-like methyltransferase
MSSQSAWQQFFDGHAERYEENPFTKHTAQEVDFFLELFSLEPGSTVLDMGCGTGRHAIELAKRGFEVVGVDLSAKMLEVARRNALRAGVNRRSSAGNSTPPFVFAKVALGSSSAVRTRSSTTALSSPRSPAIWGPALPSY